jgi:hypothetical protein
MPLKPFRLLKKGDPGFEERKVPGNNRTTILTSVKEPGESDHSEELGTPSENSIDVPWHHCRAVNAKKAPYSL